jgi:hypothetical protein
MSGIESVVAERKVKLRTFLHFTFLDLKTFILRNALYAAKNAVITNAAAVYITVMQ